MSMLRIVLGYKTPGLSEIPELVYVGGDGDDALKAIADSKFPRIEVVDGTRARRVRNGPYGSEVSDHEEPETISEKRNKPKKGHKHP